VELLKGWLETAKAGETLPFKVVPKALGMARQDFKSRVRSHPEFIEAVAELGIVEHGPGRYFTGFLRVA